ncbi:ATP-binding protein [Sporomusa sphaeroides]
MKQALSDLCRQLRLAYVNDALVQKNIPELSAVVTEVLQAEIDGRQRMKLNRLIHKAGFPQIKTLDGYSFEKIAFPSSVNQEKLMSLSWVNQQENLLMLGAVGTGKTHLAISLGVEACRRGHAVRFFRVADLVSTLQQKHAEVRLGNSAASY